MITFVDIRRGCQELSLQPSLDTPGYFIWLGMTFSERALRYLGIYRKLPVQQVLKQSYQFADPKGYKGQFYASRRHRKSRK
ncbi:MAG: hypothetical protein AAF329_01945 [Cyanobacteria bacterium P01_A01_bin.17]